MRSASVKHFGVEIGDPEKARTPHAGDPVVTSRHVESSSLREKAREMSEH
jgi:hypothetical protein